VRNARSFGAAVKPRRVRAAPETRFPLLPRHGNRYVTGMKRVLAAIFLVGVVAASEEPRTWTHVDGRTLTGTLVEKDAGYVRLMIRGRSFRLPIEKLSEADRAYIEKADVYPAIGMDARTTKTASGGEERTIEVDLEDTAGRELMLRVIWLGSDEDGLVVHDYEDFDVERDGAYPFTATYADPEPTPQQLRAAQMGRAELPKPVRYRGWAVGLADSEGKWLAKAASSVPFERFVKEFKPKDWRKSDD